MRDLLVKLKPSHGQIFCVAEVTLERENSLVPQHVAIQPTVRLEAFSTLLANVGLLITVFNSVPPHK